MGQYARMTTNLLESENPIGAATRVLCSAVADSPQFASIRARIDRFGGDMEARMQFEMVNRKGNQLQQRQDSGAEITETDVAEFERMRESLIANDVARDFLEAREEMVALQEDVQKWLSKTFELGRMPTADDMEGSCGPGCGCA